MTKGQQFLVFVLVVAVAVIFVLAAGYAEQSLVTIRP